MELADGNYDGVDASTKATKLVDDCRTVLSRLGLIYPPKHELSSQRTGLVSCNSKELQDTNGADDHSKPRDQEDPSSKQGVTEAHVHALQTGLDCQPQQQEQQQEQSVASILDGSRPTSVGGASAVSWGSPRHSSTGGGAPPTQDAWPPFMQTTAPPVNPTTTALYPPQASHVSHKDAAGQTTWCVAAATPPCASRAPTTHLPPPRPPAPMKRPAARPACVPKLNLSTVVNGQGYSSPSGAPPLPMPTCDAAAMTETGDAWEEEEADIEAELAMWEAPSCWLPPREGRHYVYKPVSSQEVARFEALQRTLPPMAASQVGGLWDALTRARYACELMASRAVRVSRDVHHTWTELSTGLMDKVERLETQLAEWKVYARQQAQMVEQLQQHNQVLQEQLAQTSSGDAALRPQQAGQGGWGLSRTFSISRLLHGRQASGGAAETGRCGARAAHCQTSRASASLESELRDVQALYLAASEQAAELSTQVRDSEARCQQLMALSQDLGSKLDVAGARANEAERERAHLVSRCMELERQLAAARAAAAHELPCSSTAEQAATVDGAPKHHTCSPSMPQHAGSAHQGLYGFGGAEVAGAALAALSGATPAGCCGAESPIGPCTAAVANAACSGSPSQGPSSGGLDWLARGLGLLG